MRILLFIFISFQLFSQDTIYFRTKEIKAVRVEEIGTSEIKYHSFDNLQGPLYIVGKAEIERIKYPNGKIDTFAVVVPKAETLSASVSKDPPYPVEKIEVFKKKLRYDDRNLSEKTMLLLLVKYPFPESKRIMLKDFSKVKTYKTNRRFGLGLLGLGLTAQLLSGGNALFFIGGAVGITGSIMACVNKNRAAAKKVEIAKKYNEWK